MDQFAIEDQMRATPQAQNARPFPCGWQPCGKMFNRKSDLARHFRIHTNERPYACDHPDCDKRFIQRSALTVHKRTHTGEKPHQCDVDGCRKSFSDSSSLARHRRTHTGNRPYRCPDPSCGRSFCRKTTLTKHQRRTHRFEGTSPGSDSDASDTDGDESSHDVSHPFQPPNQWDPIGAPFPTASPSTLHRSNSVSNLAVKMESGPAYNAAASQGHRYSYPDIVAYARGPAVDATPHPYHVQSAQSALAPNPKYEGSQLETHMPSISIKTEQQVQPSTNPHTAAHLQNSPSSLSTPSSMNETPQTHDIYYQNTHAQGLPHYPHYPNGMHQNVPFQQYQGSQMAPASEEPQQGVLAAPPGAVPPQYQTQAPEQAQQMYYDSMPYHEPTAIAQPPQPNSIAPYARPIPCADDFYKPESFAMMTPSFETMTPSMRVMHGMTH